MSLMGGTALGGVFKDEFKLISVIRNGNYNVYLQFPSGSVRLAVPGAPTAPSRCPLL
jgi:hypothetical protein